MKNRRTKCHVCDVYIRLFTFKQDKSQNKTDKLNVILENR